jgi:hypothetical protein
MMKTETVGIMAEVQSRLNSPARTVLDAGYAVADELRTKHIATQKEITELAKLVLAGKDGTAERAKDLLDGKPLTDATLTEKLAVAQRNLVTITAAQGMQERKIRQLRAEFSESVNVALRPIRQAMVTRIALALRELRTAAVEESQVIAALSKGGVDLSYIDRLTFAHVSTELMPDGIWFEARRGEGYTV